MVDRYDISLDFIDYDLTELDIEKDLEGEWIKYDDYIKEKESNFDNPLLSEVLKIIDRKYKDKDKENYFDEYEKEYFDGFNNSLDEIKKEILSILDNS